MLRDLSELSDEEDGILWGFLLGGVRGGAVRGEGQLRTLMARQAHQAHYRDREY